MFARENWLIITVREDVMTKAITLSLKSGIYKAGVRCERRRLYQFMYIHRENPARGISAMTEAPWSQTAYHCNQLWDKSQNLCRIPLLLTIHVSIPPKRLIMCCFDMQAVEKQYGDQYHLCLFTLPTSGFQFCLHGFHRTRRWIWY